MRNECGNVLFLILIAVILFAALSYAVTKSGSGNGNVDSEKTAIALAQLNSIVGSISVATDRLMLFNGCSMREIAENSSSPFDPDPILKAECNLFGIEGGNISLNWHGSAPNTDGFSSSIWAYRDYYFISLGGGLYVPMTVLWKEVGGIQKLVVDIYGERGGSYAPIDNLDQVFALGIALNHLTGVEDPKFMFDNGISDDCAVPGYAYGDNTSGTSSDNIELSYFYLCKPAT